MEKSLPYTCKDVISAQAESTAVPHEVHHEAFLTVCATEGTGNVMAANQFKETVQFGVPMIEVQTKPKWSTFDDGTCMEQVLSSDHRDKDESANEQVSY